MFLNNASALATRTPRVPSNENANTTLLRSSKSLASDSNTNGVLSMKTPKTIKPGDTQQRRRRALGDISNRKGGLAGGGAGKGLSIKKQQTTTLLSKKVNFATPSNKQKAAGLAPKPKTPAIHIDPIQEAKLPEHDYDLVLGRTTRWSTDHEDEIRSPFDLISKEELFEADTLLEEWDAQSKERARREQRELEEAYEQKLREAQWDVGLEHVDLGDGFVVEEELVLKDDDWSEDGGDDLLGLLEELNL